MTNELGGPDSSDKRDWLAGAVSDLFPPFPATAPPAGTTTNTSSSQDIDNHYIQEFLSGVMEDEFELVMEEGDPSLWKVAEQIVRVRRGCGMGDFGAVEMLRERWGENRGRKIEVRRGDDEEQETDWDSDEESGGADVDMDEAPALVKVKEKAEPEVDEDGFTKVSRKK